MPKVSIVVPIYQVEKYLRTCIDSVLAQSYTDYQLILVDDGSTDHSPQICDEYAQRDKRIKVIHKENGGLSSARNAAYQYISSDFVLFLDSDDFLERDALDFFISLQNSNNADVVVGNYWYTYSNHEDISQQPCGNVLLNGYEALENLVSAKVQNFAWGKLIRTELVKRHLFPEGKLFEDHFWTHYIFAEAEKVEITTKPIIHYRQRDDSITYTFTMSRLDILDGWLARDKFLKDYYPDIESCFLQVVAEEYAKLIWLVLTRMKKDRKRALSKLRVFCHTTELQRYAKGITRRKINTFNTSYFLYLIVAISDKLALKLG